MVICLCWIYCLIFIFSGKIYLTLKSNYLTHIELKVQISENGTTWWLTLGTPMIYIYIYTYSAIDRKHLGEL